MTKNHSDVGFAGTPSHAQGFDGWRQLPERARVAHLASCHLSPQPISLRPVAHNVIELHVVVQKTFRMKRSQSRNDVA